MTYIKTPMSPLNSPSLFLLLHICSLWSSSSPHDCSYASWLDKGLYDVRVHAIMRTSPITLQHSCRAPTAKGQRPSTVPALTTFQGFSSIRTIYIFPPDRGKTPARLVPVCAEARALPVDNLSLSANEDFSREANLRRSCMSSLGCSLLYLRS
jgi:hypothetical protein